MLALLVAAAAPPDDLTSAMLLCLLREVPRIEKIETNLESVARIAVNVMCNEPLRAQANATAGAAGSADRARETIARGYEYRATLLAVEAREARERAAQTAR